MTELILLLLALAALSINMGMVVLLFKLLCGKASSPAAMLEEEITDQRRKELEHQRWMEEGLDNIMNYDGSPRKERDGR